MGNKQIKIKKSSATFTTVIIGTLIVMAMFFGGYTYINDNVESAGNSLDSKYAETYENLSATQISLENSVEGVRSNVDGIIEAENVVQVAWNGLKGLGNTLKLFTNFINSILSTENALVSTLDILPGWAITLIFIGILAFLVLLILAILKGEPKV